MPSAVKPEDVIHLPTAVREQLRSVPSLHIPCEQTMIQCKQQLASSHATETGTFAGGAYMTDPLAYVSVLCAQSAFLAVGGDAGGGRCAIGITYSHQSVQHFAALLVYEGSDSWLELQDCRAEGLTPFVGDSTAFPHIWAVLQHLIDTRAAFLNGDWCFLNAVLGIMSPDVSAATKASHSVLSRWLQQLHHFLLRSDEWTPADIDAWRSVVTDIHQNWCGETGQKAFPKLHMLLHSLEFVERWRLLGRVSEAQIESSHATFNALFHKQHCNQSSNIAERLRRSLADASLRAVQPFLQQ